MKHASYILIILLIVSSCASQKNLSKNIVYDANAEKLQQSLQHNKDIFFTTDSADIICRDLGWAERIVSGAKISMHTIPFVFKNVDNNVFSVEMPCQEFDTNEFWASTVIVEHKRLDSALVKAKIQGVDDIYVRLMDDYEDYMRKAQFSCLCITKEKTKYIVNATIRVPRKGHERYVDDNKNTFEDYKMHVRE